MRPFRKTGSANVRAAAAALVISVLAVWRLPDALGLGEGGPAFASQPLSIVLVAALFLLFRHAFLCGDVRLKRISLIVGLLFSAFTVAGKRLEADGAFKAVTWGTALNGLFLWLLFALVFGAGLLLVYEGAKRLVEREPATGTESLFSRLLGNGFVVFALLLLCWIPVWLAFWPGTFVYDSGTQFYTYLDWELTTHHPLLHTLMMGWLMMLGINWSADGSAAVGLAIYCAVQMAMMAGILAYACRWLRKRNAPLFARVFVTLLFALFPFYAIWSFCAQKDTLFGGLILLFVLQLVDLWRDDYATLRKPWRIAGFVLTAVLMMLMRNNGLYAFLLMVPFAIVWAKGARPRVAGLLAGCVAAFLLVNGALVWVTEAASPCKVEFLSIPLQQIARTLRDDPAAIAEDTDGVLDALYGGESGQYYVPAVADPVKWATDYDAVDESIPELISLWARMGVRHMKSYAEAFLVQNLPYFLPGAEMIYRFDLGVVQMDLYHIDEHSYFPGLRGVIETYDKTLSLFHIPGVRLLSDTAFFVWLAIAGLGWAAYRREKRWTAAFALLLGLWCTCLVGPVAIIRYMLGFFYAVPVLLAAMLARTGKPKPEAAAPAVIEM